MKMSDMRAKARAIFGPAIAEPMPKQPNGAKALQERANARPIPTYKVGGAVKKAPPGPTAAEREADRRFRESIAKQKVTEAQGKILNRIGSPATREFKKGGNVQTSADTAKKLATEMGGMKKGGKAKDGLAVMIAIGKTKPIKEKATGEMYASKKAMAKHEAAESAGMERMERMKGMKKMDGGEIPTDMRASKLMAAGGAGKTRKGQAPIKKAVGGRMEGRGGMDARGKVQRPMPEPVVVTGQRRPEISAPPPPPLKVQAAPVKRAKGGMACAKDGGKPVKKAVGGGMSPASSAKDLSGYTVARPIPSSTISGAALRAMPKDQMPTAPKKGPDRKEPMKPVKRAQGGAGKVRKGMMTPEGKITHAMNKIRGK